MKCRIATLFLAMVAIATSGLAAHAQKKDPNPKKWESAQARKIDPEVRTFVTPQICDMQMLSTSRESYGPYYFQLDASIDNTTLGRVRNDELRAMYRACQEADADAIIEPLFDSYVYEKDTKVLVIELSGYPVRYTNFRPATKAEIDMIGVVYPDVRTSVSINSEDGQQGQSQQGATPTK